MTDQSLRVPAKVSDYRISEHILNKLSPIGKKTINMEYRSRSFAASLPYLPGASRVLQEESQLVGKLFGIVAVETIRAIADEHVDVVVARADRRQPA